MRPKIHEVVKDPDVAALLTPTGYPIGAKRICSDMDFVATFNRPNITLADVRNTPIDRITADGVVVGSRLRQIDKLVFATGFDAITGALMRIDVRGTNGVTL